MGLNTVMYMCASNTKKLIRKTQPARRFLSKRRKGKRCVREVSTKDTPHLYKIERCVNRFLQKKLWNSLKRLHNGHNYNHNHKHRRHFIENAVKFTTARILAPLKFLAACR